MPVRQKNLFSGRANVEKNSWRIRICFVNYIKFKIMKGRVLSLGLTCVSLYLSQSGKNRG
jgi:hypothetical protein